ncbi:MAG: organic hydroperoxide resistance protein [Chitinophagaceae bacterium]|nr:MAG: organic hydroperoxide resistance protein [Chitinophagaceae bacterium]
MDIMYTAKATSVGGRDGKVTSSDNVLNLEVKPPKEMGGPGGNYTNPEQLFAAGYSACFNSALGHISRQKKIQTGVTEVTAEVGIGKLTEGGFGLQVQLDVVVPGVEQSVAEELVAAAHAVCPYSNATRNNVQVTLKVSV